MEDSSALHPYHDHFHREQLATGEYRLSRKHDAPPVLADPHGRLLKIATVDAGSTAICPSCESTGRGAYLSFVQDLRMAYACPSCTSVVWLQGA
jgi:hypothetical protein